MYASSDMHACMNNAAVCAFVTSPKEMLWINTYWRELKDVLQGQNCGPISYNTSRGLILQSPAPTSRPRKRETQIITPPPPPRVPEVGGAQTRALINQPEINSSIRAGWSLPHKGHASEVCAGTVTMGDGCF